MPDACPTAVARAGPRIMPAGTVKRIHVNQHIIRTNIKTKTDEPACTVQWRGKSYVGRDIKIYGPSAVKQRITAPLSCGARIWIETTAQVEIL